MSWIQQEVTGALDRGEFVPYFQPLVEIRTGHIEGFEVLARWNHPTRGLVAPDKFIPIMMEQRGLINALTVCLLRQTFAIALQVPDAIGFSVNVSPTQLHDRSLPSLLSCMAKGAGFDLHRLTVEVTESALLDDLTLAGEVAADLKSRGIKLALDDFGTGYSSLLHLQALPFDEIKVDGSFVRTMVQSRQSRKITSAVISLGQSLGLRTIAEGVEEASQAELLIWQGCNLAQGWLYERPVPAERLLEVLARPQLVIDPTASTSHGVSEAVATMNARPVDRVSHLRAIYDGAPVGLCLLDDELRFISLNSRFAEIDGLSIDAHLGRSVGDVSPGLYVQMERYLRRALFGEAVSSIEIENPSSVSGVSMTTLLASFQPARDEAGEVIGVSLSVTDMTDLKQKEQALLETEQQSRVTLEKLRASEAQLHAIFQAAPVGIVLAQAPSGIVVSANPKALAIFGDDLRPGSRWADIASRATDEAGNHFRPDEMPMLRAIQNSEFTEGLELCFRRLGKPGVWLSVSASPIFAEDGEVAGGVLAVLEVDNPRRRKLRLVDVARELATAYNQMPGVLGPHVAHTASEPATAAAEDGSQRGVPAHPLIRRGAA
ncbi:MAG TPA: EAL domain-containing protein [Acidobacteriaceae bacterium]|jgi:PAS domain S-box-containing protein